VRDIRARAGVKHREGAAWAGQSAGRFRVGATRQGFAIRIQNALHVTDDDPDRATSGL
jgi:hypothetical protein